MLKSTTPDLAWTRCRFPSMNLVWEVICVSLWIGGSLIRVRSHLQYDCNPWKETRWEKTLTLWADFFRSPFHHYHFNFIVAQPCLGLDAKTPRP